MSTHYTFSLRVGYQVPVKEFTEKFKIKIDSGKFHMEKRYDYKTGEVLKKVKVWDSKPTKKIKFEDFEFDDLYQIFEESSILEETFNCRVEKEFNCSGEQYENINFYLNDFHHDNVEDYSHLTMSDYSIPVNKIIENLSKFEEIKKKLESYGFNPGELKLFLSRNIG